MATALLDRKPERSYAVQTERTEKSAVQADKADIDAIHEMHAATREKQTMLADFIRQAPQIEFSQTCTEALALFKEYPDSECVLITDELGRLKGLLMRNRYFLKFGSRFGVDLFSRKPVSVVMDGEPLVVEHTASPREVIDRALSRDESVLYDCVVVEKNGLPAGVLTMADLLKLSRSLQEESAAAQVRTIDSVERNVKAIEASIQNVRQSAVRGEELSGSMVDRTVQGKRELDNVTSAFESLAAASKAQEERMRRLQEEAGSIGKVSKLIKELAERCNLLALNASIEAARAGEHGKGFAVVAGEVRNLANQTKQSAIEISSLTAMIANSIEQTADLVQNGRNQTSASERHVREAEQAFGALYNEAVGNKGSASELENLSERAYQEALQALQELDRLRKSSVVSAFPG